jgi:hypothetical protein
MRKSRLSLETQPAVRPHLTASVAAASAGVLAASLVAVPPEVDASRAPVPTVHVTALALASKVAAIVERTAGEHRPIVVAVPLGAVGHTYTPPRLTSALTAPSPGDTTRTAEPAIESQLVEPAASPAVPDASSILGGLAVGALFFIVIPAFWVIILVTSAVNVVLGALGLPLLPNVADPPFGPIPPAPAVAAAANVAAPTVDGVARELNTARVATETGETGLSSDHPVPPKKRGGAQARGAQKADVLPMDTPNADIDAAPTIKPVTNATKDSHDFTPKRANRERRIADSDVAQTTADGPAEQRAEGHAGKKPKPDAGEGKQETSAGH